MVAAQPGEQMTFSGTLQNLGGVPIYLNGTGFAFDAGGITLDDTPFYDQSPTELAGGAAWSGDIFSIEVDPSITPGYVNGSFSILGGFTAVSQDPLATQNFTVNVAPSNAVPEPSALALLLSSAIPLIGLSNRRRR
jgi:hypothetical protein